ncbi:hypothetical protein JW935_11345 [candidate division KSB1 bacterium]|nr:hypothetical protein [candidate division KSB1 bacterium]
MATLKKTRRIDITVPEQVIDQIDSIWPEKGFSSRSAFFTEAVQKYAQRLKKASLKQELKAGYLARSKRDRELNQELEILNHDLDLDNE